MNMRLDFGRLVTEWGFAYIVGSMNCLISTVLLHRSRLESGWILGDGSKIAVIIEMKSRTTRDMI